MFLLLLGLNISKLFSLIIFGCVAQAVEQRPFKPLVEGSNPSTLTSTHKEKTVNVIIKMEHIS